jgi:hypothetical protein
MKIGDSVYAGGNIMLVSRERQLNYLLDATHPTFGFTLVLNVGRILCVQSAKTFFSRFALLCKNFIGKGQKWLRIFLVWFIVIQKPNFGPNPRPKNKNVAFP